jgi:hypothetical protein
MTIVKRRRNTVFLTWALAGIAWFMRVGPAHADDSKGSVLETITVTADVNAEVIVPISAKVKFPT